MKIHLMGIAGTGMGAFAGLLKQAGHDVVGSDENVYPPMSDKLRDWQIPVRTPYSKDNLNGDFDLVVVGNVIRKDNVEAVAMRERQLHHASFPATLGQLFLKDRHSVVVAGTHGKTTTSTLLAWTLQKTKRDPGYLIGGIPLVKGDGDSAQSGESFRLGAPGQKSPFVVEGDEYDTAYFDKGPKFLHYCAKSLLCTSLEYDHADIYPNVDAIVSRFVELMSQVDESGHIVVCADEPHLMRALSQSDIKARVSTYGQRGNVTATNVHEDEHGVHFDVCVGSVVRGHIDLPLSGMHNVNNAIGAYAILEGLGLVHDEIALGYSTFLGVKRRMEVRGTADGCTIIDDFAHHPTAVKTTLDGCRRRYAGRPVWALFEPRSASSCRKVFQDDYARAFDGAARVLLAPPGRVLDPSIALDVPKLGADVTARGVHATVCDSIEAIVDVVARECPAGAVLLCMSNGAFGGVHERLLTALGRRTSAPR